MVKVTSFHEYDPTGQGFFINILLYFVPVLFF